MQSFHKSWFWALQLNVPLDIRSGIQKKSLYSVYALFITEKYKPIVYSDFNISQSIIPSRARAFHYTCRWHAICKLDIFKELISSADVLSFRESTTIWLLRKWKRRLRSVALIRTLMYDAVVQQTTNTQWGSHLCNNISDKRIRRRTNNTNDQRTDCVPQRCQLPFNRSIVRTIRWRSNSGGKWIADEQVWKCLYCIVVIVSRLHYTERCKNYKPRKNTQVSRIN